MKAAIKCIRKGCDYSGKECEFWNDCVAFQADREEGKKQRRGERYEQSFFDW